MDRSLSRITFRFFVPLLLAAGWLALPLRAQDIRISAPEGPYYVGEPFQLQVTVRGLEEEPEPECVAESVPDGLDLEFLGVVPQITESMTVFNGRMRRSRTVVFRYSYRLTASKAGDYDLGPFNITQGAETYSSKTAAISFGELESSDNMRIALELPADKFYEGQRIPIKIRWTFAGDANRISAMRIYSPLFDQFAFDDNDSAERSESMLPIQTSEGQLRLPATGKRGRLDGEPAVEVVAERFLIAETVGDYEIPPIQAVVESGRASSVFDRMFDDPFFGPSRRRSRREKYRAIGKPLRFSIAPIPTENRPQSFTGAVGEGFSMEVTANRTVVRVGDPISLDISIRGQGNLPQLSLPPLSADGGMPKAQFQLPTDDSSGVYSEGMKQFNVTVRAREESIQAIPPLAFSWFNPVREQFETTRSKPVALKVMPAQMVGSQDVVSNVTSATANDIAPESSGESSAVVSASAADLAIETDLRKLMVPRGRWTAPATATGYAAGIAALALGIWGRSRQRRDPEVTARRRMVRALVHQIRVAQRHPANGQEFASHWRQTLSWAGADTRADIEAMLADLETEIYAPGSQGRLNGGDFAKSQRFSTTPAGVATMSWHEWRSFVGAILLTVVGVPAVEAEDQLAAAVDCYQQAMTLTDRHVRRQQFRTARLQFENVIDQQGNATAALWTNLGNAALQSDQLGTAIVAYRRALAQQPGYRRAVTNLAFARSLLPASMRTEQDRGWFDSLFFWTSTVAASTLHVCAALAFATALATIAWGLYRRRSLWRNLAMLPALVWIALLLSTFSWDRTVRGVVVAEQLTARSADSATSASRLSAPVPGGTEFEVFESRDAWYYVKLPGGQAVWLPASGLELLP